MKKIILFPLLVLTFVIVISIFCFFNNKFSETLLNEQAPPSEETIIEVEPSEIERLQTYIRTEEATPYLEKYKELYPYVEDFNGKPQEDIKVLSKLANSRIRNKDITLEEVDDYWQTPKETLSNELVNDYEDWSIALLSLIKSYDDSLNCYILILPEKAEDMPIFCYFAGGYYEITTKHRRAILSNGFLQREFIGEELLKQEKESELRDLMNDYFKALEISPAYRNVLYAINNKQVIKFNDYDEFFNWAFNFL